MDLLTENGLNLFGIQILPSSKKSEKEESVESFVEPEVSDGSDIVVSAGAHQIAYLDLSNESFSDIARIRKYREMAMIPEVDQAIEDIVSESIVSDEEMAPVRILFDDYDEENKKNILSDKLKKSIEKEFDHILYLLDFNTNGHDIFRQWYVDGRIVFHKIINEKTKKEKGIIELRNFDPINIKKIKEVDEKIDPNTGARLYTDKEEYFVYSENTDESQVFSMRGKTTQKLRISKDSIAYCTSGLLDEKRRNIISFLHKAIKPANQLNMLENALVIYMLARAPERRVFYVDVGNLPTKKAEEYLNKTISKFRNKISYDASTGEIKDKRQSMAMVEDFWLPRCISLDTEIELMSGDSKSLSQLIDEYDKGIENWTYSVSPNGEVVPGLISWAGMTRKNAQMVKVTLDNGESIKCTPDHKFILRDGTKVEAQHLSPNDPLMSFYKDGDITDENHKVISVEWLSERENTGTLTIDQDHVHHDYHNFATSAGVFIMNSSVSGRSGTEISTLSGGTSLASNSEYIEYFKKKLFRALNVPLNRMEQEAQFSLGRTSEITRDEVKFSKFISRLRRKFSDLFYQLLSTQLILKNIVSPEEWESIRYHIRFDFIRDNHFTELKEAEIIRERLMTLRDIDDYTGRYFSKEWIMKNVLRQSDSEIDNMRKQIEEEKRKEDEEDDFGDQYGMGNDTFDFGGPQLPQYDGGNYDDDEKGTWTDSEDKTIRMNPTKTAKELAKILPGRSANAISNRRSTLGIPKVRKPSGAETKTKPATATPKSQQSPSSASSSQQKKQQ